MSDEIRLLTEELSDLLGLRLSKLGYRDVFMATGPDSAGIGEALGMSDEIYYFFHV